VIPRNHPPDELNVRQQRQLTEDQKRDSAPQNAGDFDWQFNPPSTQGLFELARKLLRGRQGRLFSSPLALATPGSALGTKHKQAKILYRSISI